MIAFSRCIYTTKFTRLTFIEKYRKSVILLIWLYAIIMFLIELYWNEDNKIGYNCILGRCDIIQHPSKTYTIEIFTNYLFAWPSLLVLICYCYMGWHFHKNHKNLQYLQIGSKFNLKVSDYLKMGIIIIEVEMKVTQTLILVTVFYLVVLFPQLIIDTIYWCTSNSKEGEDGHDDPQQIIEPFTYMVYVLPYSTNFLFYVARNSQYREAFSYFIKQCQNVILNK